MLRKMQVLRKMQMLPKSLPRHCLAILLASLLALNPATAQDSAASGAKPADIRILIDVSGSMKQNDPRNLRRPALDLLSQLVPAESRAGVWTFGRYVNMLVPHAPVNDSWRASAAPKSQLINSVALHTNIGLALEKANYDSNAKLFPTSLGYDRAVILLTDGVVDIATDPQVNQAEQQRIREEVLSSYQQAGVAIHAIALSTQADAELLEWLADKTGGSFAVAEDASDLNRIFLNALDRAAPAEQVPLQNNRFMIDSSIEEFTALVFRKPGSSATELRSPAGDTYSAQSQGASLRWFDSDEYDLITIKQPVEGEWQINAELDPANRVTVVSNLSVAVSELPVELYAGDQQSVSVRLSQDSQQIIDDSFLDLIQIEASLGDSTGLPLGRDFQEPGHYQGSVTLPASAGVHTLEVAVDGKTFERQKNITVDILPAFKLDALVDSETGELQASVVAANPDWQSNPVQLSGFARTETVEQPLLFEQSVAGQWQAKIKPSISGSYEVVALAGRGGQTLATETVQLQVALPEPLVAATPLPEKPVQEVVEVAPEPEPQPEQPVAQPEPEPVVAAEEAVVEEAAQEEGGINYPLVIGGLVGGNLLLIGGLYLVYRKMTASPLPEAEAEAETAEAASDEPAEVEAEPEVAEAAEQEAPEEPSETEPEVAEDENTAEQAAEEAEPEVEKADAQQAEEQETVESAEQAQQEQPSSEVAEDDDVEIELETGEEPVAESEQEAEQEAEQPVVEAEEPSAEEAEQAEESVEEAVDDSSADASDDELLDDLDQLIEELGEDLESEIADETSVVSEDAAEEQVSEQAGEEAPAAESDDDDITLDFDGEFDLSTDISEDLKRSGGTG